LEVILLAQSAAPTLNLLPQAKPPLLYSEKEGFCKNGPQARNKQLGVPLAEAAGSRCRYSPSAAHSISGSNPDSYRGSIAHANWVNQYRPCII